MDTKGTPFDPRSMREQIELMMFPLRAVLWKCGYIGVCELTVASVGSAGVKACSLTERHRDIGTRIALGAGSAGGLAQVI